MASSDLRNVVLIGATGTVGSHILQALLDDVDGDFKITILSRPTTKSFTKPHPAVTEIQTSFEQDELHKILAGQDAVVHAAGIPSLAGQFAIIDAAVKAGVKRVVLNEFANSPVNQKGLPELEGFRTTKKGVMEHARHVASTNPSFSFSALSTGNFLDYSLKKFPQIGVDVPKRKVRFVDDGSEQITAVTLEDIGIAIRGILSHPSETKNRVCHIRSVQTCQAEIFEAIKAELGEEGWDLTSVSSTQLYETGKTALAQGNATGRIDMLITQLFAKGGNRSIVVSKEASDNDLLGVVEKDIGVVVKNTLASFDTVYAPCIIKA